jgi:hypothetical protein
MFGTAIHPFDGFGTEVVMADIAHQVAGQGFDGGEDSVRDDIALNFGKLQFDLVEPRRIGWM